MVLLPKSNCILDVVSGIVRNVPPAPECPPRKLCRVGGTPDRTVSDTEEGVRVDAGRPRERSSPGVEGHARKRSRGPPSRPRRRAVPGHARAPPYPIDMRLLARLTWPATRRHPPAAEVRPSPRGRLALPRRAWALVALVAALLGATAPAHAAERLRPVVVTERHPASAAAERLVRRADGTVGRPLPLAGGFAARVPARALPALRRARSVAGLWSDGRVRMRSADDCPSDDSACFDALPAEGVWQSAIGLDAVPNKYQGDDVTVASIDTGVTETPNLAGRIRARVDLTADRDGIDHFGHGTHMAGLIAGDGETSDGAFDGAAPETSLVSVKVAGWDGATDVSTVIAALQWVVSNAARLDIRVVNLSWGTDASRGYGVDPLDRAVERAWQAGLVVVVSAGNAGPGPGTVSKPADDPYVVTVGAADTNGTAAGADDTLAPFSSRGPTADGVAKPDLVAPGVSLPSDRAPGSTIDTLRPAARVGDAHFKGSGTSQAAAVAAGVAARMLEATPALTNDEVKGVLLATADPRVGGPGA